MSPNRRLFLIFITLLFLLLAAVAHSKTLTREETPEALQPWIDWVKWKHPKLDCPMTLNASNRHCVWPGHLEIEADEKEGHFQQQVTVYQESWVKMPGSLKQWPQEVTVNGEPAVVTNRNGPTLKLPAGEHRITGRFGPWNRMPETLSLPQETGLVSLSVNGKAISYPEIQTDRIWLRHRRGSEERTPQDRVSMEVYRKVSDGNPVRVLTRMVLDVSGRPREILLSSPLIEGFAALAIRTPLPARLEHDRTLRLQVRPGHWEVDVDSVNAGHLERISKPEADASWPAEEIWSFESNPEIRQVEVSGSPQIDPRQTRLPENWKNLPAYQVTKGQGISLKEVRRGDASPAPDNLSIHRTLWLDFDGEGWSVRDRITGKITKEWRLSADPVLQLGRIILNDKPQFITQLKGEDRRGVEVRRGEIDMTAESRIARGGHLPATGWGREFESVSIDLNLPPGYQLLSVFGVDHERSSWTARWTLYDLFVVFLISVAVGKLWGWRYALPALAGFSLLWHVSAAPQYVWLYLLAMTALLRVVTGERRKLLQWLWYAGIASLVVISLPFIVEQIRTAIYPQLDYQQVPFMVAPMDEVRMNSAPPIVTKGVGQVDSSVAKIIGGRSLRTPSMPSTGPRELRQKDKQWRPDPNARIQTGPGLPNWQWHTVILRWNGPVSTTQDVRLFIAGPKVSASLNLLRVVLLLLLAWRFWYWRNEPDKDKPSAGGAVNQAAASAAIIIGAVLMGTSPADAATNYPPQSLLDELENRVLQKPECLPHCANIQRMWITLTENSYQGRLEVHAAQETSIPLPVNVQQQPVEEVFLDQEPSNAIRRDEAGVLWMRIPKGWHEVAFSANLPQRHQIQIPMPLVPHRVIVDEEGWSVEGIDKNGRPDRHLLLTRKQDTEKTSSQSENEFTPQALPPFVEIARTLHLGMEWTVETRVRRLSPVGNPISLHVPLLPGEALLSEEFRAKEGKVLISMASSQREAWWRSRIDMSDKIGLTAAENAQWVEVWQFDISPHWHPEIKGIAPVHHQGGGGIWLPTYRPWPGETVEIQLNRPIGVEGSTSTIDQSMLKVTPGKRASQSELTFSLRASQGGHHEVELPESAELMSVQIDGKNQPVRQDGRKVSLPVHPGNQRYKLIWRESLPVATQWRSPQVDLGTSSVNARVQVIPSQERWIVWVNGPRLGPAVLFWGELLTIALIAFGLGRLKGWSPLGTTSWLLLGIGLSQAFAESGVLVVATLLLFGYRHRIQPSDLPRAFNLLQVALVIMSLFTAGILFSAVQQGLLGHPDMQIAGNNSYATMLNWYQDMSDEILPQVTVISFPMLAYRLLMLAWALWLAFSILRWIKWGWGSFSTGGRWVKINIPKLGRKKQSPKYEEIDGLDIELPEDQGRNGR